VADQNSNKKGESGTRVDHRGQLISRAVEHDQNGKNGSNHDQNMK
jgi:hypothetical protein